MRESLALSLYIRRGEETGAGGRDGLTIKSLVLAKVANGYSVLDLYRLLTLWYMSTWRGRGNLGSVVLVTLYMIAICPLRGVNSFHYLPQIISL